MIATLADAQAHLAGIGILAFAAGDHSVCFAAKSEDAGAIRLFHDTCLLARGPKGWIASFPDDGSSNRDVESSLPELVSLIEQAYRKFRLTGGRWQDAFGAVLPPPARDANGTNGHAIRSGFPPIETKS